MRPNPSESDLEQYLENLSRRNNGMQEKVRSSVGVSAGRVQWAGSTSRKPESRTSVAGKRGSIPVSSPYSPYANKWELNYSKVLEMEKRIGAIKSWKYSGLTFTTAYRQYHRIDFIIGHNDRSIEIAQVKGYHPNMRAAIKGLKWAAQLYPMFTWTLKRWTGTGWDSSYVEI